MTGFFEPNLGTRGRFVRGFAALLFLAAAFYVRETSGSGWGALALAAVAGGLAFQALSGWCLLRACGFKTRL